MLDFYLHFFGLFGMWGSLVIQLRYNFVFGTTLLVVCASIWAFSSFIVQNNNETKEEGIEQTA